MGSRSRSRNYWLQGQWSRAAQAIRKGSSGTLDPELTQYEPAYSSSTSGQPCEVQEQDRVHDSSDAT